MAIVGERIESRRVDTNPESPSAELLYYAAAAVSEQDAITAVSAVAPGTYGDLVRQGVSAAQTHPGIYDVTVRYGPRKPREPGDSAFSFDISTGTQRITQSRSTVDRYAVPGRDPVDYQGAIGVARDGTVEGAEILVPEFQYTEEHTFESLSAGYIGTLFGLTGKVNDSQWKHFAAGECLFVGATGRKTAEEEWRVTYTFLGAPNLTGLSVGDIDGITKDGWDYLWVVYEDVLDNDAGLVIQKPVEVHIERVYDRADFDDLGIGS